MTVTKDSTLRTWKGDLILHEYSSDTVYSEFGIDLKHVVEFTMDAPEIVSIEEKGMGRLDGGLTIAKDIMETSQGCTIKSKSMTRDALRIALMGTDSDFTQSAGNDGPSDFDTVHEKWALTGKLKLDPATPPVITHSTGSPTYVEDTDYVVDYHTGSIMTLSEGACTATQTVKLTKNWLAITVGFEITANTEQNQQYYVEMKCYDDLRLKHSMLIVPKIEFELASVLAFINSEFQELDLKGTMLKMDGLDLWTMREWT